MVLMLCISGPWGVAPEFVIACGQWPCDVIEQGVALILSTKYERTSFYQRNIELY